MRSFSLFLWVFYVPVAAFGPCFVQGWKPCAKAGNAPPSIARPGHASNALVVPPVLFARGDALCCLGEGSNAMRSKEGNRGLLGGQKLEMLPIAEPALRSQGVHHNTTGLAESPLKLMDLHPVHSWPHRQAVHDTSMALVTSQASRRKIAFIDHNVRAAEDLPSSSGIPPKFGRQTQPEQPTTASSTSAIEVHAAVISRRNLVAAAIISSTGATFLVSQSEPAEAATTTTATSSPGRPVDWQGILSKSSKRALGGGKAGAAAAVVQVFSLMWLRTSMNYQYRYGGTLRTSLETLWSQGGISRLYQGLPFALIQGPLTRFGDTAANVGVLALLDSLEVTRDLPLPLKTACGSFAAGAWRIILMPVDASKTAMQVEGEEGLTRLRANVLEQGPGVLYRGALAQAAATTAGHFPWFLTYNYLNEHLPSVSSENDLFLYLVRSAFLGLSASCVSDIVSNSLRVLKTTKQTSQLSADSRSEDDLSYSDIARDIIQSEGLTGLLGRGLQTRLLTNAIQGAVFSVCWKYFQQMGGAQ